MGKRKVYRPGQLFTINGKLFRAVKPKKQKIYGMCHLCDLAVEHQKIPGCLCHKYCYRRHSPHIYGTGPVVKYYLKRL